MPYLAEHSGKQNLQETIGINNIRTYMTNTDAGICTPENSHGMGKSPFAIREKIFKWSISIVMLVFNGGLRLGVNVYMFL